MSKLPKGLRWLSIPVVDWKEADAAVQSDLRSKVLTTLDAALAAGSDALDKPLDPSARASAEEAMAIVREARAGDPFEAFSPDVVEACLTLVRFGAVALSKAVANSRRAARAAAGRTGITQRGIEEMLKISMKFGWSLDDLFDPDKLAMGKRKRKLAGQMGVSVRTIERYIDALKKRIEAETDRHGAAADAAKRIGLT